MKRNIPSENKRKCSYVFSVSVGTGCYRHIRVDGHDTLEMLSSYILQAFEFDEDHAHAFFMDNKAWSGMDCYYADFACDEGDECRYTSEYSLKDIQVGVYMKIPNLGSFPMRAANNSLLVGRKPLEVGDKFKYVFDFGDDWRFDCKVLKILEEETKVAHIVRSKGESPMQYGDDEFYEFDEYDECDEYDE